MSTLDEFSDTASVRGVMVPAMVRAAIVDRDPAGGVLGAFVMSRPVTSGPFGSSRAALERPGMTRRDSFGCLVMKGSPVRVRASAL